MKKKTLTVVAATLVCCNLMGAAQAQASNYQINAGDTLSTIASEHKITVEALKKANNLTDDTIFAGGYLYIPDGGAYHTVAAGETLSQLANRYQLRVADIKNANNLTSDTILVGQKLWIPLAEVTKKPSRSGGRIQATAEEITLMAKAVYGEARGEDRAGQIAVAAVILNRVQSPEFPNTIRDVIFEPWAFTCVSDGQFDLTPNAAAYEAVRTALEGIDPTYGALYYWNPKTATSPWIWSRAVVTQIGQHLFGF